MIEMALGRYPIPQPPEEEIEAEMKQPPAGAHQFRLEKNRYASHESAIRMPIFELLQIIFTSVSVYVCVCWGREGGGGVYRCMVWLVRLMDVPFLGSYDWCTFCCVASRSPQPCHQSILERISENL